MTEPSSSTTAEPSSSGKATEACAQCNKTDVPLKACNKCHTTMYCGKDCQKAHFKTHKKVCASLAQEYVKNNEPKMASRSAPKSGDRSAGLQKWQVCDVLRLNLVIGADADGEQFDT
ncbi:uncharacterized protein EKO05_0010717 [Ascochyta rabiei]|uniref:Metal ion binding n=1 Tax=Didymella rabiei TaxID=5454 RepID=A0A163L1J6_DIDRA|nr:uncharacterized protein EKO05_0010717 [Ascochyta rabiei]KZM27429.1 metal ion binding [Ascochyta rabiei]UPX20487.1 hypothetical protein EKO05_0010717 [Ascochyta rabiei]